MVSCHGLFFLPTNQTKLLNQVLQNTDILRERMARDVEAARTPLLVAGQLGFLWHLNVIGKYH